MINPLQNNSVAEEERQFEYAHNEQNQQENEIGDSTGVKEELLLRELIGESGNQMEVLERNIENMPPKLHETV